MTFRYGLVWFGLRVAIFILAHSNVFGQSPSPASSFPIRGICLTAPPEPFVEDPFIGLRSVSANWVAIIPFAFQRPGDPYIAFREEESYWWGEGPAGVLETVERAKSNRFKTLLKPQVYVPTSWTGSVCFGNEADWHLWEESYERYLLFYANMAEKEGVDILCIGTEYKLAVRERSAFWIDLIRKIRAVFSGKITYAANWDAAYDNPLWEYVDLIGINAYFPLDTSQTPTVRELVASWRETEERIQRLSLKWQKPVLFTEFGYLSVDHCAAEPWNHTEEARIRNPNQKAQANAIEALFQVFSTREYWLGGFLWKWYPSQLNHLRIRDYTPQGKKAEQIIRHWYQR